MADGRIETSSPSKLGLLRRFGDQPLPLLTLSPSPPLTPPFSSLLFFVALVGDSSCEHLLQKEALVLSAEGKRKEGRGSWWKRWRQLAEMAPEEEEAPLSVTPSSSVFQKRRRKFFPPLSSEAFSSLSPRFSSSLPAAAAQAEAKECFKKSFSPRPPAFVFGNPWWQLGRSKGGALCGRMWMPPSELQMRRLESLVAECRAWRMAGTWRRKARRYHDAI